MEKRSELWAEAANVTVLSKGQKVIVRRPPGRPRVKPVGAHHHYNWIMKTPTGNVMRCRNHGCDEKLRSKAESLTCSEACRLSLERYCEVTLAVLRGEMRAREYPPDLRAQKGQTRRTS